MKEKATRDIAIDAAKFLAIVLVVIGHCIQFGSGSDFEDMYMRSTNAIWKYIYSFHMPLFGIISGYLFYFSASKRTMKELLKTKMHSLLIPILSWQLCINIFRILHGAIIEGNGLHFKLLVSGYRGMFSNMWFLWSMLACSLIVMCIHYIGKDKLWIYLLAEAVTLFIPKYQLQLWLWMFPYFAGAFLYAKYRYKFNVNKRWGYIALGGHSLFIC